MKHLRFVIMSLFALSAVTLGAEVRTFVVQMTKCSVFQGDQYIPPMDYTNSIEIRVTDKGILSSGIVGGNKSVEYQGGTWFINSTGELEIEDNNKNNFLFSKGEEFIRIKHGKTIMLFRNPKSVAEFNKTYNDLLNYLKQIGKLRGGNGSQTAPVSGAAGAVAPPASLNGKPLELIKMFGTPFGLNPVKDKKYTIDDLNHSAKSVWGWNLQLDYQKKRAGYKWRQLNGMTFLNYPVYEIFAYDYSGGDCLSDFYCKLIIDNTTAAKRKIGTSIAAYMKSKGWIQVSNDIDRPCFYKGNIIVECYSTEADNFSGKLEYVINAQSFPSAQFVKERLSLGLG